MSEEVVGYRITRYANGTSVKETLTEGDIRDIEAQIEAEARRLHELMPDEESAIQMMAAAYHRLKDFGWQDPTSTPLHGAPLTVLEAGSTGQHDGVYLNEWPHGRWVITGPGGRCPSHPVMWKAQLHDLKPVR